MKINNINSDFVFSDITLQDPKGVQGGLSYTTKVLFNKEPLFILISPNGIQIDNIFLNPNPIYILS